MIRTSTSSMTSVPKPLKFLRPHYPDLKAIYFSWGTKQEYDRAAREDELVEREIKKARVEEKKKEPSTATPGTATPAATDSTPKANGVDGAATNGIVSKAADLAKAATIAAASAVSSKPQTSSADPTPAPFRPTPGSVKGVSASDQSLLADILSVLAMTYSDSGKRETLAFRLRGHRGEKAKGIEGEDPGLWGHEYVRHLASEIGEAYVALQLREIEESDEEASGSKGESVVKMADGDEAAGEQEGEELHDLALKLVPFLLSHNGEADAVDLLLELESIEDIVPLVSERTLLFLCVPDAESQGLT